MVGGIIKKAGKVLKEAKKAKETSKFLTRRKTLGGASKAGYPDWFKQWLKESKLKARESIKPSEAKKKEQVKKFVDIRKKTKPAWSKK